MLTGTNLTHAKRHNLQIVHETIRLFAPISRADVARRTGLTAQTISNLVRQLIDAGLVVETARATAETPTALAPPAESGLPEPGEIPEAVTMALRSLRANWLRTLLTLLGIGRVPVSQPPADQVPQGRGNDLRGRLAGRLATNPVADRKEAHALIAVERVFVGQSPPAGIGMTSVLNVGNGAGHRSGHDSGGASLFTGV